MKKALFLIIIFSSGSIILSQSDSISVQQSLEPLLEDVTLDNENEVVLDMIEYLTKNPLAINSASIDELMRIPFMDYNSATIIINFRNSGIITSLDQLRKIDGLNGDLVEKISPYIRFTVSSIHAAPKKLTDDFEKFKFSFRTREQLDIQENAGTVSGKFTGSPWKIYNRVEIDKSNKFNIGVLTEKDPGEKYFYDFVTAHFQIKDWGCINSFILGDYQIEFGEGLSMWSKYKISKRINAVDFSPSKKSGSTPYLSSDENDFLRGSALTLSFHPFTLTSFYSFRYLDASVDSTSLQITSYEPNGLHRTISELNKKNRIRERIIGSDLNLSFDSFGNIGFLFFNSEFSNGFNNISLLYPKDRIFNYISFSYSFHFPGILFHGENASNQKYISTLSNIEFIIDKNLSLLLSYRNYPLGYWNSHSQGFGERSSAQNENGFYFGLKYTSDFGIFNFYYDQYKLFVVSQNYNLSSANNELLLYYSVRLYNDTQLNILYTIDKKGYAEIVGNSYGLVVKTINKLSADLNYNFSKRIISKTRIEFVDVTPSDIGSQDRGFLLYQDLHFIIAKKLSVDSRIVIFQTDSYNSRIYEYENDLAGSISNSSLYGEGIRWYILLRYSKLFNFTLSLKYSELYKPFENTLGSGYTEIFNNLNNMLSFQLDYNL
jgi:hypothetical protein